MRTDEEKYVLSRIPADYLAFSWRALHIPGGIAMSEPDFSALASSARKFGDHFVEVRELSGAYDFPSHSLNMEFDEFNNLKRGAISHVELLLLPKSKKWVAALTEGLEAIIFGASDFFGVLEDELSNKRGR